MRNNILGKVSEHGDDKSAQKIRMKKTNGVVLRTPLVKLRLIYKNL